MPLMPAMEHAPVSAASLLLSAAASVASNTLGGAASRSGTGRAARSSSAPGLLASLSFPVGVFPTAGAAVCIFVVLFHARCLERRKGSARYFLLCLWPAIAATIVSRPLAAVVSPPGRASAIVVAHGSWAGLVSALVVRYVIDVPALGATNRLADKWLLLGAALKFVVLDAVFSAPHGLTGASVAYQLGLAAVGAAVGFALGPQRLGQSKLVAALDNNQLFDRAVTLLSTLLGTGGRYTARHAPKTRQPPHGAPGAGAMMHGAGGDDELAAALAASMADAGMAGARAPPAGMRRGPAAAGRGGAAPAAAAATPAVDEGSIELLMGLGLGVTRAEAQHALRAAGGNVDKAAELLMER